MTPRQAGLVILAAFILALMIVAGSSGTGLVVQRVESVVSSSSSERPGWTNVTGALAPPAMAGGMMAYSSRADTFVLFGGWNGITYNETWSFNPALRAWSLLHPRVSPPARGDGMLAYDVRDDAFLLFGGWYQTGPDSYLRRGDTWVFFLGNDTWTERHPISSPTPRSDSAFAYSTDDGITLLLGGFNGTAYLGDVWYYVFANDSWIPRSSRVQPSPRADGRMVFDEASGSFYLFSGNDYSGPGFTFHHIPDNWRYDWRTNDWTEIHPASMPTPRDYPVLAPDPGAGELLMTGGFGNGIILGDTWAFNTTRLEWANITTSRGPIPRMAAVGGFDPVESVLVLFGGGDNSGAMDDTWFLRYPPPIGLEVLISTGNPTAGQDVTFAANIEGGSGRYVRETWSFGDGGTQAGAEAVHGFPHPGTFLVRFDVLDDRGDTATWSAEVVVASPLPGTIGVAAGVGLVAAGLVVATWMRRLSRARTSMRETGGASQKAPERPGGGGKSADRGGRR